MNNNVNYSVPFQLPNAIFNTDMKGSLDYNITLSENRADAVVNSLTEKYSIAPNRLSGHGVGPLCPVSSNSNEDGRKLNRRVELVVK